MYRSVLPVTKRVCNVFQFLCPKYVNLALTVQAYCGGEDFGYIVGIFKAVVLFEQSIGT